MKSWAREFALGLLLATAMPSVMALAAQSAEQILLDKANYWRLKDRPDLGDRGPAAALSINPNQPDALYQYGIIKVQQGKIDEARTYLDRLRKTAPSSSRVADLENAIRAGQVSPSELSEARRLAQSGQILAGRREIPADLQGSAAADLRRRVLHDPGRHAGALERGARRPRTAGAELAE